jgi:uncharacterized protein (DUF934 family)
MPKLIKKGKLTTSRWQLVSDDKFDLQLIPTGKWILPLSLFNQLKDDGQLDFKRCAVSLSSSDSLDSLKDCLAEMLVIALNFTAFADGRSFSQARILRDQLDYEGDIRACGNYLQDQLFYLHRCGVSSFEINDDADPSSMIERLTDFTERYQAACDEPQPLYRRRA